MQDGRAKSISFLQQWEGHSPKFTAPLADRSNGSALQCWMEQRRRKESVRAALA